MIPHLAGTNHFGAKVRKISKTQIYYYYHVLAQTLIILKKVTFTLSETLHDISA
jgi:hypothetical protein